MNPDSLILALLRLTALTVQQQSFFCHAMANEMLKVIEQYGKVHCELKEPCLVLELNSVR